MEPAAQIAHLERGRLVARCAAHLVEQFGPPNQFLGEMRAVFEQIERGIGQRCVRVEALQTRWIR